MKSTKKSKLRPFITTRIIEAAFIVIGIVGLVMLFQYAKLAKADVAAEQKALETRPNAILLEANIRSDLRARQHDIDRVFSLVGTREEIGDVVVLIEGVARNSGVQVQVPDIKEEVVFDGDGNPVSVAGPYRNVLLTISAVGDANRLVEFAHRVDHLPRLIIGENWRIRTNVDRVPGFINSPGAENVPGQSSGETVTRPSAVLDATLVLSVENHAYEAE